MPSLQEKAPAADGRSELKIEKAVGGLCKSGLPQKKETL